MTSITTFLTFNDRAEEAAEFYTSIFPDSRITQVTHYPELDGLPAAGSVMTVEFELMGRSFIALNGGPEFSFNMGFSIFVECETQQEVDDYWAKLTADGGKEVACGWLADKFGVSWQITPKLLMDALRNDDPEKVKRAMASVMHMVKIDSDALRNALE